MKIITIINNPTSIPRKAYMLNEEEKQIYLDFKEGIEVLPAAYSESETADTFNYVKRHEPGEKGWKDGGYECIDSYGLKRAFYLDALIVHPKVFRTKRKPTHITKSEFNKPEPGKRGRPSLPPELRKTQPYVPTGARRGRKPLDPSLKKEQKIYVSTGQGRGRKPLSPEMKAQREAEKAKLALLPRRPRGRPRLS
jgi:hypothetical protein